MPENDEELQKKRKEERKALPEMPEQGDTSALSPLTQPQEGIDMSKRPKTKAPSGARKAGMQMAAEARQFGDEFRTSLQEDKENIRSLFSNPERQAERQERREERKAAKRQTAQTAQAPDSTAATPQGQTEQPVQGQTAQPVENAENEQGGGRTVPVADGGTLNETTVTAERGNATRSTENGDGTAIQPTAETGSGEEDTANGEGEVRTNPAFLERYNKENPNPLNANTPDFNAIKKETGFNPDGSPLSSDTGENEDEVYQRLIEQYGDEESFPDEYAKYRRNTSGGDADGGGDSAGGGGGKDGSSAAGAGAYDPNSDPRVKALDEYSTAVQGINNDFETWSAGIIKEKEKYDEEQQRRDRQNAFWHGIGEVGAALVNLLGVSGAFGGKNAYGRGAYSAMQNFNLTTEKMTDRMRAAAEKRREALDSLNERLENIRLQRRQGAADIILKKGEAEGKAQDTAYQRARDEEHWKTEIDLRQQQINNAKEQADRQYQLSLKAYEDNKKALDDAAKTKGGSGGSGGSGGGKGATPVHLRYPAQIMKYEKDENGEIVKDENGKPKGEMVWGWKYISAPEDAFYKTLHPMRGQLADELARMLGFTSFNDFNGNVTWDKKAKAYVADTGENKLDPKMKDEVKAALMDYRTAMESTRGRELSKATDDKLNDWADKYWALSDKFGAMLDTALASYNPYGVSLQSYDDAPEGYGGGAETDNDFPDYDGAFQGVN